MLKVMRDVWYAIQEWLETFGASQIFLVRILAGCPAAFLRPGLIIRQVYASGVLSLAIIGISGFFVGLVLAPAGLQLAAAFRCDRVAGRACGPGPDS